MSLARAVEYYSCLLCLIWIFMGSQTWVRVHLWYIRLGYGCLAIPILGILSHYWTQMDGGVVLTSATLTKLRIGVIVVLAGLLTLVQLEALMAYRSRKREQRSPTKFGSC